MSDFLVELREANLARQKEWDAGASITLAYLGNALAGEVGEACNIIKKLEREALGLAGSRATPERLGEELADVAIYLDLIAARYDLDLATIIRRKFNKTSQANGFFVFIACPVCGTEVCSHSSRS